MSNWRRLGQVYNADGESDWAISRAYCPTPVVLESGDIRVFCAFLDSDQIGRCGFVDVAGDDPTRVLGVSRRPALGVGQAGTFDEHGVTPLSVVRLEDGALRLYYAGWQRGVGVRYSLFTGVAESDDEGTTFGRCSEAPVLDRSDGELHTRTGVFVMRREGRWRMWYAGGSGWITSEGVARPTYELRHLFSEDGLNWPRHGEVVLAPEPGELGFGRPCVVEEDGAFQMWFGRRAESGAYTLGYATSPDGLDWRRADDLAGLPLGPPPAWDSEMVGLASLVDTTAGRFLFYNGNGYGATGFGVAVADER